MVEQIMMYAGSAGTPHRTEHEAWKSDLILWIAGTETMNEASAKQFVEHITSGGQERANELANMIKVFAGTMPCLISEPV